VKLRSVQGLSKTHLDCAENGDNFEPISTICISKPAVVLLKDKDSSCFTTRGYTGRLFREMGLFQKTAARGGCFLPIFSRFFNSLKALYYPNLLLSLNFPAPDFQQLSSSVPVNEVELTALFR
jgi:hypothetical protein